MNGLKIVNVLLGDIENPLILCLFESKVIEATNSDTIVQTVYDVLHKANIKRTNLKVIISDSAPYMCLATKKLRPIFPKLIHIGCLYHLIHNACMKIKNYFAKVNDLISNIKFLVLKNAERKSLFQHLGYPPVPIITRFGTWLQSSLYYINNFKEVENILNKIEGNGKLLVNAKQSVNCDGVENELYLIKNCYIKLLTILEQFEKNQLTVKTAINEIDNLEFCSDPCGIKDYLVKRISKNGIKDIIENTNNAY